VTGNNPKYVLEDGRGLTVKNVSLQDSGVYTCRAEVDTDGRYDERKITVNVHGKFLKACLFLLSTLWNRQLPHSENCTLPRIQYSSIVHWLLVDFCSF